MREFQIRTSNKPRPLPSGRWAMTQRLNDLLFAHKGGSRKFCGILTELNAEVTRVRHLVIGIGINVHHAIFPDELDTLASSLLLESDLPVFRSPILISLLRALDRELTLLESGSQELLQRFARHSTWVLGKRVHVPEQGGYTGRTAGLDEHGFLLVDCDDGIRRTVLSGGVREA